MRVVLVNPPAATIADRHWAGYASLGLGYVASSLLANGVEVVVVDGKLGGLELQQVVDRVCAAGGDLIGITAMTLEFPVASRIAFAVKERSHAPIIIGGAHANAVGAATLRECAALDLCCVGEGEDLIVEVARCIGEGGSLAAIAGLAYRDGERIVANGTRPFRPDYDSLPFPAWHLFPEVSVLPVLTHRGCPFRCVFCSHNSGTRVRYRSVGNTLAELEHLVERFRPASVRFEDETFGLNLPRTKHIVRGILERGLHRRMSFSAQTRVDCVDAELMSLMKRANFHVLELGVESGSDAVLQRIGKGITRAEAVHAVALARAAHMKVWCKFILGHPHETPGELRETVRFISALNPDRLSVAVMTPYPGTPIYDMAVKGEGGYRLLSTKWEAFDKYSGAALELEQVSVARLKWLQLWCYIRLYVTNFRFLELAAMALRHRKFGVQMAAGLVRQMVALRKPLPLTGGA